MAGGLPSDTIPHLQQDYDKDARDRHIRKLATKPIKNLKPGKAVRPDRLKPLLPRAPGRDCSHDQNHL